MQPGQSRRLGRWSVESTFRWGEGMAGRSLSGAIELVPVDARLFPAGRAPHVDLYRVAEGRGVLCYRARAILPESVRHRHSSGDTHNLYVRFVDGHVQAGGATLSELLSLPDDELAPDVKARLIYGSAISMARLVFLTPGTPRHIDVAMDIVSAIAHQIANEPRYLTGLLQTMRNDTLYSHSVNVCIYTTALAHHFGHEGKALTTLGMAAFLHDIGKARVPDSILEKPAASMPRNGSRFDGTRSWGSRCLGSWRSGSCRKCERQCSSTTSGWMARATHAGWPARTCAGRLGLSPSQTSTTR